MTGKELRNFCQGKIVPIEFNERIEELDERFENGMKAYIVYVGEPDKDQVITINIEERDFAEYNKSMEKATCKQNPRASEYNSKWSDTWYGKDWNGKYTLYEMEDEIINFKLLDESKLQLFRQYQSENINKTYVEWLENKVLSL